MNTTPTETALTEVLRILESIAQALRSADLDASARLQAHAVEMLRRRRLDCADRMIVDKVMGRIRKASPGSTLVLGLEECLAAA